MKSKHLLLPAIMLMFTALTVVAQNATDKKPSTIDILFGEKSPPPDIMSSQGSSSGQVMPTNLNKLLMQAIKTHDKNAIKKTLDDYRQQLKNSNEQAFHINATNANSNSSHTSSNADFHLTKDINALSESNPSNNSDFITAGNRSYAILNQVMYFSADDGIHGSELWRSDGTDAGTFLIKDIEPGIASSNLSNITAVNGKIYFSATTANYGTEPWVSDGTAGGTQLLMDVLPGDISSNPTDFVAYKDKVYFVTDGDYSYLGAIWKTDGTTAGTGLLKNLGDAGDGGYYIAQLTKSNGLLFFTFISNTVGFEVWRSNGTDGGTYQVGTAVTFYDLPLQLTSYNNKLYFSANGDGIGFKLWQSDGTDAGTMAAPGNNDILLNVDYNFGSLPILNNVLYLPGAIFSPGCALYKYDASNSNGVVKVKDLADADFIYSSEMKVAGNALYFKTDNLSDVVYDELWSSKGTEASTKLVDKTNPNEFIYALCDGNGTLHYVKNNKTLGTELWKIVATSFGSFPMPETDIFKGSAGSYPNYLTAFKDKVFFSATDNKKGNELFMTTNLGIGASIVKDINTVSTGSSYGGYYINAITPLGNDVLFTAFEKEYGHELYKSDGTEHGTALLNDIVLGEVLSAKESYPYNLTTKNNAVYFIASDYYDLYSFYATRSIYKSDGTKAGLQKIAGGYSYIYDFKVADNGLVYYVLNNGAYQLWRSDGTVAGTILLSSTLYATYALNVAGNVAFFVAGDATNGNELWKSDGSVAGTKMVKDINPGIGNSSPKGMFVYKNEVYFEANNGVGASFWKSDGTKGGTIQLREIDPWYSSSVFSTERYNFEISNNILYFAAINYANAKGTELWKTDGTKEGTKPVKDISPDADSYYPIPYYLTDVNGTLFFITNNSGVNGTELWKTDGTKEGTQLVKDITPGTDASGLNNLTSFGGKLYFTNSGALWSSDGTADGTTSIDDAVISGVYVYNIVAASNQLFLSGSTPQYGIELYAGKVNNDGKIVASKTASEDAVKTTLPFNATLYPNPVKNSLNIKIISSKTSEIKLLVSNVSGKLLQDKIAMVSQGETVVPLDVSRLPAGSYFLQIINTDGSENSLMKFVKQ